MLAQRQRQLHYQRLGLQDKLQWRLEAKPNKARTLTTGASVHYETLIKASLNMKQRGLGAGRKLDMTMSTFVAPWAQSRLLVAAFVQKHQKPGMRPDFFEALRR